MRKLVQTRVLAQISVLKQNVGLKQGIEVWKGVLASSVGGCCSLVPHAQQTLVVRQVHEIRCGRVGGRVVTLVLGVLVCLELLLLPRECRLQQFRLGDVFVQF